MGVGTSAPETPPLQLQMEGMPPNYPDMNVIFKGIPKMMQVADDMHRMTNYIMDLRNMMLGLSIISMVGMFFFLLLKYIHSKNSRRRRRRFHPLDSDQTSLSRVGDIAVGNSSGGTVNGACLRYYAQQKYHPFGTVNNLDWTASRHVPVDMEKLLESQHTTSTAATHHVSHNVNNVSGPTALHRQTPPHQHAPFSRTVAYHPYQQPYHQQQPSQQSASGQPTAGGTASGSATSGATASTVAIGDDSSDQVEIPYSLNDNSSTNAPFSSTVSGATTTTTNGFFHGLHHGHPLIIANGGVTSPAHSSSAHANAVKVGGVGVSSAIGVLTTTTITVASK